jgi:CubicO group peptidase (beta-lactamase class C family)
MGEAVVAASSLGFMPDEHSGCVGLAANGDRRYIEAMKTVPQGEWTVGREIGAVSDAVHHLCTDDSLPGTLAMLVVQHGEIIAERYQPDDTPNPFRDGPPPPTTKDTTLISWSMAKSMTQALLGMTVCDGLLHPDMPAPVPAWQGTEKQAITLQHLLNMRSGLNFVEDYVDGEVSDVIEMLFGDGKDDVATYAESRPTKHEPGAFWSYSSGETNILSRIIGNTLGGGEPMRTYINDRLFGPLGMASATAKFDPAGTFIGSSFVYATARDFARFGLLYLHDGLWGDRQLLPAGWVERARLPTPVPAENAHGYGEHWWLWPYEQSLACHGYEGQRVIVLPDRDAVVVTLGKTDAVHDDLLRERLHDVIRSIPTA